MRAAFAAALLAITLLSMPAKAETKDEMAFGFGQFIGAASFCKVARDKVQALAKVLLASAGIDASQGGPEMTRFTEGVTDGVRTMSTPEAASCEEVTAAFDSAYARTQ